MPRRTAPKCPARGAIADLKDDPNVFETLLSGQPFFGPAVLLTSDDWKRAVNFWWEELVAWKQRNKTRPYVEKHLGISLERIQP
jgi:hypothetical protein